MSTVRSATIADAPSAVATLVRAFDDDPPLNWVLRKDARRAAAFTEFFDVTFRRMTLPFGCVELAGDGRGVALWTPPGKWQLGALKQLGLLPAFARVIGLGRLPKILRGVNAMQRLHPRAPHYYLFALGVDPAMQGRGLGSILLSSMLARADAARMPAYLESSTEMSRRLYERHGFVARDELLIAPDAPPIWPMWREPKAG